MTERRQFLALKEQVGQNKITLHFDRRKSIEYYNQKMAEGAVAVSAGIKFWHWVSWASGPALIAGGFAALFYSPRINGVLLCFLAVYLRIIAWRRLKNHAVKYVSQQALASEEVLNYLYRNKTVTVKNTATGKTVRHPEKWTVVLNRPAADEG